MNTVVLIGRLTANPEMKTTTTGKVITKVDIAVPRTFSKDSETDFIPVVAWNKTAEFLCQNFTKGQRIALAGRLQIDKYTDSKGDAHKTFSVVADSVEFADGVPAKKKEATATRE